MRRAAMLLLVLAAMLAAGAGGFYLARHKMADTAASAATKPVSGPVVYYQDPDDKPEYSAVPRNTADGRPFRAVHASEDVSFDDAAKPAAQTGSSRKVLYYRNPMGLPDTSPTPKKDWMGMDYIAVFEGEEQDDGQTVKVSLDKLQRSGVRTEPVETRVLASPVRGIGTVKYDERRITVVTLRTDGYIEDLFVNTTGQFVRAGAPLFRVYSRDIQLAQSDLIVAAGMSPGATRAMGNLSIDGSMQRLRNLAVPESRINEVQTTGINPRTIDWPSPTTGTVVEKRIINGQQVAAGAELYRIVDLTNVWVIAEISEAELAGIKPGTPAMVTLRAYPQQPVEGRVTFIYPELRMETRTARVRIEVPNPEGRLKVDMYADVVFQTGADEAPVIAVPMSAVIDSGTRQVVLIAKGEGRFEPRVVKLGRRGDGYIELTEGVTEGEEVVTAATFLIDAESNLKAALQAFTQPEAPK